MTKSSVAEHRAMGTLVLSRLAGKKEKTPAELKPYMSAFATVHKVYEAAAIKVDKARALYEAAMAALSAADSDLDDEIGLLADCMVGEKMGSRTNPFKGHSKHSPAKLCALAFKTEVAAVRSLVQSVSRAKPTPVVEKALVRCTRRVTAVESALKKVTIPEIDYRDALTTREQALADWTRAYTKLRKRAAAVWVDEPGRYKNVFAKPNLVQKPKVSKKAAKKAAAAST